MPSKTFCKNCLLPNPTLICKGCGKCKKHVGCICVYCARCNKSISPKLVCKKCGLCKKHHQKEKLWQKSDFPFRQCTVVQNDKVSYIKNQLPRSIGVEIELSHWGTFNPAERWNCSTPYQVVHDGSVKPSGQELVLAPMHGDTYITTMQWLSKVLTLHKTQVNTTCGYHVHIDSIDLVPAELRKLFGAWYALQYSVFGTLVNSKRALAHPDSGIAYSKPIKISKDSLTDLFALKTNHEIMNWFYYYLYKLDTGVAPFYMANSYIKTMLTRFKSHKYENNARRQALNFHSWMMRGTVEFRLKEGTVDPMDLLYWPLWCGWFVQKIVALPDSVILDWVKHPPALDVLTNSWTTGKGPCAPKELVAWVKHKQQIAYTPHPFHLKRVDGVEAEIR